MDGVHVPGCGRAANERRLMRRGGGGGAAGGVIVLAAAYGVWCGGVEGGRVERRCQCGAGVCGGEVGVAAAAAAAITAVVVSRCRPGTQVRVRQQSIAVWRCGRGCGRAARRVGVAGVSVEGDSEGGRSTWRGCSGAGDGRSDAVSLKLSDIPPPVQGGRNAGAGTSRGSSRPAVAAVEGRQDGDAGGVEVRERRPGDTKPPCVPVGASGTTETRGASGCRIPQRHRPRDGGISAQLRLPDGAWQCW
jgi:hypothetical protein